MPSDTASTITQSMYERHTGEEWEGSRVRTRRELKNRLAALPRGTELTVTRKWGGFDLRADACEECGVQVRITDVPPEAVRLVEPGWEADDGE